MQLLKLSDQEVFFPYCVPYNFYGAHEENFRPKQDVIF